MSARSKPSSSVSSIVTVSRPLRRAAFELNHTPASPILCIRAEVRAKLADHPLLPIVELALATGMRRGELLGLQWQDIDLDAATVRVERSVEKIQKCL